MAPASQSFRSIKGVAGRTVSRVMAEMPEIGTLSHKRIAKLAGLAPFGRGNPAISLMVNGKPVLAPIEGLRVGVQTPPQIFRMDTFCPSLSKLGV